MAKCNYCIKETRDRYTLKRYKEGINVNVYCDEYCKGRTRTLISSLLGITCTPKKLNKIDRDFIERFILEFNPPISKEEMYC